MANHELAVINAVCKNKDISGLLASGVDELFSGYGDVWEFVKDYYGQYRSVPDLNVIQRKFPDLEQVDISAPTEYYLGDLRNDYLRTKIEGILTGAAKSLDNRAAADVLERIQAATAKLNKYTNSIRDLDVMDAEAAMEHFAKVRERSEAMGGTPGIPTGFTSIDACYPTGMAPGHLISIIGWPAKGKTWFAARLAINAWKMGYRPMLISLEMGPENMRDRVYTMMGEGRFSMGDFNRGDVNIDDFREWSRRSFTDKNNFIVVSPEGVSDVTPNVVQGKIDQHKPDIVIMDYHQLFSDNGKNPNPTQRGMALSREIKLLATRNQIPIVDITAATQSDVSDRDSPPTMAQVAWSKAIEYDADIAMAVHRHDESGLTEVVGRKNRHGDLFDFHLEWDYGTGRMKESYGD